MATDRLSKNEGTTTDRVPKNGEGSADTLPEAIRKISAGVQRLSRLGLNRKSVIVLLVHETKIGARTIEEILDGLADLAHKYTSLDDDEKRSLKRL